jgi:hypothetical protein
MKKLGEVLAARASLKLTITTGTDPREALMAPISSFPAIGGAASRLSVKTLSSSPATACMATRPCRWWFTIIKTGDRAITDRVLTYNRYASSKGLGLTKA